MGIKHSSGRLPQVRKPISGGDLTEKAPTELAGLRAPPRTPQRQRGLWGFLVWQFVIAPIVAAASLIEGGHALATDDQDDRPSDHQKDQPDSGSDHNQAAVGTAAGTPDDSRNDQTDASSRLLGATPKALPDRDGPPHEEHAGSGAHDIVATTSPAGDGQVGDRLEAAGSDAANCSLGLAAPGSGIATAGSPGDASGVFSSSPIEISLVIGEPTSGGLSVDVGGELTLALATSGVVSTLTSSLADILATVDSSSSLDLKDYLGFDLHVNSVGEFVANDLGAVLDSNPSFAVLDAVGTAVSPVASPVLSVANLVADGLPILGTLDPLDRLLDEDNHDHSVVGHGGDLAPLITSGDPISALVGDVGCSVLSSTSAASVGTLPGAFAATSSGGGPSTDLPFVVALSEPAHVNIVVEATATIPGHSIEFPKPAPPEGDVLFHGNSYTDYHVALQSAGPSSGNGSVAATLTGAFDIPDATSLTHADGPVSNAAPSTSTGAAVQHADVLLTHIATTLDELSLRSHTH
jgi:hypothetical protein